MENIKLTWDKFQTSATFKDIYQEKSFLDVTLASEDHKQIKAHKVVLSASSPFFKDVLANNSHPHPFLYLKGIKMKDLEILIKFIYFGETEVPQADLSSLLLVASELQVKGLCDQTHENTGETKKSQSNVFDWDVDLLNETVATSTIDRRETSKANVMDDSKSKDDQTFIVDVKPKLSEDSTTVPTIVLEAVNTRGDQTFAVSSNSKPGEDTVNDLRKTNDTSITVDKGSYKCDQCSSTFKYLVNLIPHIKKKHGRVKYDCKECDYKATNNYDLYVHLKEHFS